MGSWLHGVMGFNVLIIAFTIGLLSYYFYCKAISKGCRRLPGPLGIPLLGYMPFLRKDTFRQFQEMTKKYGNIFSLNIGIQTVVVLNDWTTINEAFNNQRNVFAGRPQLLVTDAAFGPTGIVNNSYSENWKLHKKLVRSLLREIGVGKTKFEMYVQKETQSFAGYLGQFHGLSKSMHDIFYMPTLNMMASLLFGEQFEYDSEEMKMISQIIRSNFKLFDETVWINLFPYLRYFSKGYKKYRESDFELKSLLQRKIDEHKSRFVHGNEPTDYATAYLYHILKCNTDETSLFHDSARFTDDIYLLYFGGTDTTSNTLSFGILYMSVWHEIQTKVQLEIDEIIGKSTIIQYSDRLRLPYTEAVLLEVQRYLSHIPLSVPHMTLSPTKLCGYDIPANTEVWPNLWAVHHDPDLWGDPEVFRPERFIDSEGKVVKPEYLIPFSVGTRRCLGEDIAKVTLFLFFATMMQKLMFRCPVGHPPPSVEPIPGLSLRPHPYSIILQKRF